MGWSIGYDNKWKRFIGYGVIAYCDHPECNEGIDRGLSYVCGSDAYGGEHGCGLYFCEKHRDYLEGEDLKGIGNKDAMLCEKCLNENPETFTPKPEHHKWIHHVKNDPSWEQWRKENPNHDLLK